MLETGVFTLGVFTNDDKVDVLVSRGHAGEGLADDDGSVDVEGLSHGDVPRVVASDFHRGVQDTWRRGQLAVSQSSLTPQRTLQPNLVPLQAVHSLPEQGFPTRRLTADIVLFPLDGHVDRLEDLLDTVGDLRTDTVTGDEGTGELAYEASVSVIRVLQSTGTYHRTSSGPAKPSFHQPTFINTPTWCLP